MEKDHWLTDGIKHRDLSHCNIWKLNGRRGFKETKEDLCHFSSEVESLHKRVIKIMPLGLNEPTDRFIFCKKYCTQRNRPDTLFERLERDHREELLIIKNNTQIYKGKTVLYRYSF